MKVTFSYFAQIRQQAGCESECVEVPAGASSVDAMTHVSHGKAFQSLLFDDVGAVRPSILWVVNGLPVTPEQPLVDGDRVQLFSPVAGG